MNLLAGIEIQNFRCFRNLPMTSLAQASYLIGVNNSGKTAVLSAIQCFFDTSTYKPSFINKTELLGRGAGANKTVISIEFDLEAIEVKKFRARLIRNFGQTLVISKTFAVKEISKSIEISYAIRGRRFSLEELDKDVRKLLESVHISYIHPQEGLKLLKLAQEKLKSRLLHNWGRHATISEKLVELEEKWHELRRMANSYLSSSLTENLRKIWPGCEAKVDLPEKVKDIIAISEIVFKSDSSSPEVSLTAQGTGAQSTILYQTHYLLDSDRSLHQGLYFPVWLLEEPESFLHADISIKLGRLLNSDNWLGNIQMIISTHSPIILAESKANEKRINWIQLDSSQVKKSKYVKDWTDEEIKDIGRIMGDINFEAYFYAADRNDAFYIEDTRGETAKALSDAGIVNVKPLNGATEVKKYVDVFSTFDGNLRGKSFFLVDNDKGAKEFKEYFVPKNLISDKSSFKLYRIAENVHLILMPRGYAFENLFEEFDSFLSDCVGKIYTESFDSAPSIPAELSRTHGAVKGKPKPLNEEQAKNLIKNSQEVKDLFWSKVVDDDLKISEPVIEIFKTFLSE